MSIEYFIEIVMSTSFPYLLRVNNVDFNFFRFISPTNESLQFEHNARDVRETRSSKYLTDGDNEITILIVF